MNRLLPRLAPADAAEHFPGPRAITTTPSVAECESLCQPIGGDMAIGKERLGEINRHLRVVGPPQAAVASLSDEPPDASFQRAAFVGSAHRIASGEPKDAADEAICFHVDTAESRPLPNGPDQWLAATGLSTPLGFIASPLHRVVRQHRPPRTRTTRHDAFLSTTFRWSP